jgi:mannose-6-phosphate isomerase-like protein (cupin superfamily)
VTDKSGNPVAGVQVAMSGPVDRSGTTGSDGQVEFKTIGAGTYRLRFERKEFITLEREIVVRAGAPTTVSVALNVAPPPPAPPIAPAPAAPPESSRAIEPRTLSIPDFLEKNFLKSEPQKTSLLGCADGGTARLIQVRDPLENQLHTDVDELIYVVAGDGTIRIRDKDSAVGAGSFALVPRRVPHNIRRQGRNPLIVLSVLAGARCTEQ